MNRKQQGNRNLIQYLEHLVMQVDLCKWGI